MNVCLQLIALPLLKLHSFLLNPLLYKRVIILSINRETGKLTVWRDFGEKLTVWRDFGENLTVWRDWDPPHTPPHTCKVS